MMKRKAVLTVMLAAAVSAAAAGYAAAEEERTAFESAGYELSIPNSYVDLLDIQTLDGTDGEFFRVCEKASVDAAGTADDHAGWIFSLGCVTEEEGHEMLCNDMSGADIFAKDADSNYWIYYHPTDVPIVREGDITDEDLEQYGLLHEWATQDIVRTFVEGNEGLEYDMHSNTALDIMLARILYKGDVKYTISTTEFGPLEPGDVDPLPFLEKLTTNIYDHSAGDVEAPDGEYVVLDFPEENLRFDFFAHKDDNFYREVNGDIETVYQFVFPEADTYVFDIMQEWYDALAKENGKK